MNIPYLKRLLSMNATASFPLTRLTESAFLKPRPVGGQLHKARASYSKREPAVN